MNKLIFLLMLCLTPLAANAQSGLFKFGYLSYSEALKSMPEYAIAQHNIDNLRQQYDDEIARVEGEFNVQYEDFLSSQKNLAPSILVKRQAELKEIIDKNIAFRAESTRLIEQATRDAYSPVKDKLNKLLREIGIEKGYAFILNTDNDTLPFIDMTQGEEVKIGVTPSLSK